MKIRPGLTIFFIIGLQYSLIPMLGSTGTEKTIYLYLAAFAILVGHYWYVYKRHYTNLHYFAILLYLLGAVFPFLHYLSYNIDKQNYLIDSQFLEYKTSETQKELSELHDSLFVHQLLDSLPATMLNYNLCGRRRGDTTMWAKGRYKIEVRPKSHGFMSRPRLQAKMYLNNELRSKFSLESGYPYSDAPDGTLRGALTARLNYLDFVHRQIRAPGEQIEFHEIWGESTTGFLFGYIKAVSPISKAICFFQFICIFFFLYMASSLLSQMPMFQVERKVADDQYNFPADN